MSTLTKNHTFVRKVTLVGVTDDGKDAEFMVTFKSFPDDELLPLLNGWELGHGDREYASQRTALDRVIAKASCKLLPTDEEARDFLVNGNYGVRMAAYNAYRSALGGDLLQKN